MNNIPQYDHKLLARAEAKATGQNIHSIRSLMASYINEFALVKDAGKKWTDKLPCGMTRAEFTFDRERELRATIAAHTSEEEAAYLKLNS